MQKSSSTSGCVGEEKRRAEKRREVRTRAEWSAAWVERIIQKTSKSERQRWVIQKKSDASGRVQSVG